MKRRIVLASTVVLFTILAGCGRALPPPRHAEEHAKPYPVEVITSVPEKPKPTATPLPTATPMATIDAPWYRDRNEQLRKLIRNYRPTATEAEIDQAIARMAIDPNKPMVALTFDDGPKPGITDKILDVLEQYNARATFFVLGWRFGREGKEDILRRAVSLGCEIGNHTWSHDRLPGQNYVAVRNEIRNTNKVVFDITGVQPHCFRPPGGQNTYEAMRVARENDMVVVLWSQSGNVHESDPNKIAQNVEKQIVDGDVLEDGDIVLLHDTHVSMVDAVKIIVPKLIDEGYQLVTVWELLNCADQPPVYGRVYDRQGPPIEYR
jgi:peptidoglycan/xylan/chitin deacetylase (PgdA/CDA1 family)